jgi:hypothetical protein
VDEIEKLKHDLLGDTFKDGYAVSHKFCDKCPIKHTKCLTLNCSRLYDIRIEYPRVVFSMY